MNKMLIALVMSLASVTAFAAAQSTGTAVPKNLHIYSESGVTYVDHNAAGCSGSRYYIPSTHPRFDTIISILLSAQIADKPVELRFDGCNNDNQGKVVGIYLK